MLIVILFWVHLLSAIWTSYGILAVFVFLELHLFKLRVHLHQALWLIILILIMFKIYIHSAINSSHWTFVVFHESVFELPSILRTLVIVRESVFELPSMFPTELLFVPITYCLQGQFISARYNIIISKLNKHRTLQYN